MDNAFLWNVVPACRHADGTISSSSVLDVWRMASEDSDQLVPGLAPIHRLHHFDDLCKTLASLVSTGGHELNARSELLEVESLGRPKRVLPEKRYDPFHQILATTNDVAVKVLPMVVRPPVDVY